MEYGEKFQLKLVERTHEILEQYGGENDATILLNCLLGLLAIPNANLRNRIPQDGVDRFSAWGLEGDCVKAWGMRKKKAADEDIREVVRSLRNAVTHFHVKPLEDRSLVTGFCFWDDSGFRAKLTLTQIEDLARAMTTHLNPDLEQQRSP